MTLVLIAIHGKHVLQKNIKEIHYAPKNAATATERKEIVKETGARYSELHRLPYYDPIRMHTIDPMHNLYLGTAKHVFVTWINIGVLSSENLSEIDARMNNKTAY